MMSDFKAPGDIINSGFQRESSPQAGRLYPSLDSLVATSDSFEEIDSDTASIGSVHTDTPPLRRKFLFPKKEFVDKLLPEEVRWFYKGKRDKKWIPFIGYDSLRIECRYRVQTMGTVDLSDVDFNDLDLILVRGGLYEVDVSHQTCNPVYWSGFHPAKLECMEYTQSVSPIGIKAKSAEQNRVLTLNIIRSLILGGEDHVCKIMRGTWFYDGTWQPLEIGYASQIEAEHLGRFLGHRLDDDQPVVGKGPKSVLHVIKFSEFYIEWNSPTDVFMFSDSASSRLFRAVGSKLGMEKSGSRLHRGYCYEAVMDDKPVDITHLVFVVHGIGQKMDTGAIVKSCQDINLMYMHIKLRDRVDLVKAKLYPDLDNKENERAEFLPVEWRSSLKLDGDTVETLTPQKLRGIRTMLNASAMDVLYYTSPLYRQEITQSLETELNRLYLMFCERHPYFEPNGGKVSVIAHSLGCVITYDIITDWNPIQLYDQFVSSVIEQEKEQAAGSTEMLGELDKAKKRISELESLLMSVHEKQHKVSNPLKFQLENLFCLGSPLGIFLALRGIRPQGKGSLDHIIPGGACKRLFNVYHPADPVAYRLEPLILKHYSTVKPLVIHSYESSNKTPYTKMESSAYAAFQGSNEVLDCEKMDVSDKDSVDSGGSSIASKEDSPSPSQKKRLTFKVSSSVGGWFSQITRGLENDKMSAELKMFHKMKKEAEKLEKSSLSNIPSTSNNGFEDSIDQTELEYRLDYQLKDPGGLTSGYIAMITSHTSYWTNRDIACFILSHLHPSLHET